MRQIPDIRPSERAKIREDYDKFVKGNGHNSKALHLPHEKPESEPKPEPRCGKVLQNDGCPLNGNQGRTEWRLKDVSVYPPGYHDICKSCVRRWRNDG